VTIAWTEVRKIELGDVRGGYDLAMQANRLRHALSDRLPVPVCGTRVSPGPEIQLPFN
jgi:hypothetical protein